MASHRLLLLFCIIVMIATACGSVRPRPAELNPADYTPVEFNLLRSESPSLHGGQLVRTQAFFWQFLTHDPSPRYYYFNQLRYPVSWSELEWFALYQSSDMRGYFDRAVMSYQQRLQFDLKRLEPLVLYGELVPMGGGQLYLQVYHLERIVID